MFPPLVSILYPSDVYHLLWLVCRRFRSADVSAQDVIMTGAYACFYLFSYFFFLFRGCLVGWFCGGEGTLSEKNMEGCLVSDICVGRPTWSGWQLEHNQRQPGRDCFKSLSGSAAFSFLLRSSLKLHLLLAVHSLLLAVIC